MKTPCDYIQNKIDGYFNNIYYQGKKIPFGKTGDEILAYEKWKKSNYPLIYRIDKFNDKISRYFSWYLVDVIKYPKKYYSNVKDNTHVITTGLKKGEWHDTTTKLFHGMFHTIVFFVEQESKSDIEYYYSHLEECKDYPEHQKELYKISKEARDWYKERYPLLLKDIENLYDSIPDFPEEDKDMMLWVRLSRIGKKDSEIDDIHKNIRAIEKTITKETQYHLHNIVKNIDSLWS
jgi:hypothetical protein